MNNNDTIKKTLIVVEDFSAEPTSVLENLLKLQQNGCTVVSRQDWCEVVLSGDVSR